MAFGTAEANGIIDGWDNHWVSLHTGDPGSTGASEVTGGSYARQQISLATAANKQAVTDAVMNFLNMPDTTSTPITHVGLWTLQTAGAFEVGGALAASKVTNAGDTFQFPVGDLGAVLT